MARATFFQNVAWHGTSVIIGATQARGTPPGGAITVTWRAGVRCPRRPHIRITANLLIFDLSRAVSGSGGKAVFEF
jgi:hypothetical protein